MLQLIELITAFHLGSHQNVQSLTFVYYMLLHFEERHSTHCCSLDGMAKEMHRDDPKAS